MTTPAVATLAPAAESVPVSDAYRRYALGLLLVVFIFNFIDRQILTILAEAIRLDLGLSDTALGFLGGFAFAVFYSVAGIPIARWADRGVRRSIIALGLFAWSAMTAVTGFAQNFLQLALARIGVGLGEAACSPPAHSLISDYFPPERRGTAFAIYALGIPVGGAIGTFAGGWIKELFDWRTAFFVVGLPGLALAVVVRLTLREPERGRQERRQGAAPIVAPTPEPVMSVIRFMLGLHSFRHLSLAAALHAFYGYGAAFFLPVFMIRVHGFSEGELSSYLALISLLAGGLGTFLGGFLGDRLALRDKRWYLWLPGYATLVGVPFAALVYLWPDRYVALGFAVPAAIVGGMWLGPTFAMTQGLVRAPMRALASAILLFIINLVGLGIGPMAVGMLSDAFKATFAAESVRYALLIVVTVGAVWSALHYLLAARTLRADLEGGGGGAEPV